MVMTRRFQRCKCQNEGDFKDLQLKVRRVYPPPGKGAGSGLQANWEHFVLPLSLSEEYAVAQYMSPCKEAVPEMD